MCYNFSMNRQSGNVFFIIFIGIALFAALGYAVSQSMRTGGDFGSKEKIDIQAADILGYASMVETTVKSLKANGCSDTQISFENSVTTDYSNTNSPSSGDKNCWVFESANNGIAYQAPVKNYLNPNLSASTRYGEWVITGRYCFNGIGTGTSSCAVESADLVLLLPYIKSDLCERFRKNSGALLVANLNITSYVLFRGTFSNSLANSGHFANTRFGCFNNGADGNTFYKVLIAR